MRGKRNAAAHVAFSRAMRFRRVFMHRALAVALALFLGGLWGCAAREAEKPVQEPAVQRLSSGVWTFRHKVRLEIPGRGVAQSFDGLMRLDVAGTTAHVAGVAGLGMQLFDMRVTPDSVRVDYMHPLLARLPGVSEHAARCIRKIWFDCLTRMPLQTVVRHADVEVTLTGPSYAGPWPELVRYVNVRVPYTLSIRLLQAQQEEP